MLIRKNWRCHFLLFLLVLMVGSNPTAAATNLKKLKVVPRMERLDLPTALVDLGPVAGFTPVVRVSSPDLRYPVSRGRMLQNGLVDLLFMVNREGVVFSPVVQYSTHPAFEREALKSIQDYKYLPAKFDSALVDSMSTMRMVFTTPYSTDLVSARFATIYNLADRELGKKSPNEREVWRLIRRLKNTKGIGNHGFSRLYFLESVAAEKFGDSERQLHAIRKLMMFESRSGDYGKYIDDDLRDSLTQLELQLLLNTGRYGEARAYYYQLEQENASLVEPFLPFKPQLDKALTDPKKAFRRKIEVGERGYELIALAKRAFWLEKIEGEVGTLRLRCDVGYYEFEIKAKETYEPPADAGKCNLQVDAKEDTEFDLLQY